MANRIDVHTHVVPPDWARALAESGHDSGGVRIPEWTAEGHIAFMDELEIGTSVLSVTNPGTRLDGSDRASVARAANEFTAEQVKNRPDRFGHFAILPQSDVDASVREIAYAYDELGADGVVLMSSEDGVYLGDPKLTPVWEELDRRSAVVFVHPSDGSFPMLPDTPAPLLDFTFDTTRTAVNLVLNGVFRRSPNLRVILSHAGGYLPYVAQRVTFVGAQMREGMTVETIDADLHRFYFDTALSSAPTTVRALLDFAAPGHVLYGSDHPFAPPAGSAFATRQLDAYPDYTPGQLEGINTTNALPLFPRIAEKLVNVQGA